MFELQGDAQTLKLRPRSRMPESKITNLMKVAWQHMLEKTAHEFLTVQPAGAPLAAAALLIAKRDALVVQSRQPAISHCDTEGVTGQVVQDPLCARAPRHAVDNPFVLPDHGRHSQGWTALLQPGTELAPDKVNRDSAYLWFDCGLHVWLNGSSWLGLRVRMEG